jgi:microcystin-dependent protein
MQRVKRSTAVAVLPAHPAGGTPGYFPQPDPGGGVPAAVPGYEWYNNVQEEIVNVILAAGGTLDGNNRAQMLAAIQQLIVSGGAPGEIVFFAKNTAPVGYLKANGAAISRGAYSALFAAIGTTFGAGDGSTTFSVPDLRGRFARGWVDDGTVDTGRAFGSSQTDALQGHYHSPIFNPGGGAVSSNVITTTTSSVGGGAGSVLVGTVAGSPATDGTNGTPRTAAETRPNNIALLACIKY